MGPGPAHLGPGSPQVNAFCGHRGPQAADAFTGRGFRALWDPGPSGHSPFSPSPAQTLESRSVSVHVCRLGAGWGRLSPERLSAPQAGLRPESPRETWSLGVGPARSAPAHQARNPGAPLIQAPGPPSSSLALCLCRGGRRAGKCGPREKERTSGWRGELPVPRTGPQGPCEAGLICPGWGPLPRGRLVVGLPALYLPGPASWPETGQLRL